MIKSYNPTQPLFLVTTLMILLSGLASTCAFVNIQSSSLLPPTSLKLPATITTNHVGTQPHARHTASTASSTLRKRGIATNLQSVTYYHALLDPMTHGIATLLAAGGTKFILQWKTYSLIPVIASIVGWVTNYLAVKMSE